VDVKGVDPKVDDKGVAPKGLDSKRLDVTATIRKAGRWLAAAAAAGFACLSYIYLTLPDVRPLRTTNPATTAFIELRAREARAKGEKPRRIQRWVSYRSMSPNLTRAVLVAEDSAFWEHEGLDVEQLQESLEADWASGRFLRGGSTITQQLAKNLYLSPSRNPLRKLKELMIARRLEAELSKSRILELYLNVIEWGDGIYGAEAAARTYFQSGAGNLEPSESAILAGAIVNPRVLNPAHPNARLLRRQGIIMRRMGSVTPPAPVEDVVIPPPAPPVDSDSVEPLGEPPLTSPAPAEEPTAEPESPNSTNPANSQEEPVTDLNSTPQ
jgi:monofunctional biosynthetic peptidoglycan transglycosylase